MSSTKLYLEKIKSRVDKRMFELFEDKKPESLYKPCSYINHSSGKRLRPILVYLSNQVVGGNMKQCRNAAIAVELLHNFTLVHDDIMDNADTRRGRKTLHVKNDLSTAILAGDSLVAAAYQELLKDCKINTNEIVSEFTKGIKEVCEGQSLDKDFETRKNVTLDEYLIMIEKKTAALFTMCCSIGGYLGNATKQQVSALHSYGKNLGIAFQIQDDLLDIVADKKKLGKKIGGDLIEGKKTYLFLKALEKAKGNNKKLLKDVIKTKGVKQSDVKIYKKIYEELGILSEAEDQICYYTKKAKNALKKLNDNNSEKLNWLAEYLATRNK